MKVLRYTGRLGGTTIAPGDHDDSAAGPAVISDVQRADLALIDDPMSFPWELMATSSDTPLVLDISSCSADQITALRPALVHLTAHDSIVDRSGMNQSAAQLLNRALGTRATEPSRADMPQLCTAKRLHIDESAILRRARTEYQLRVTDMPSVLGDVDISDWATSDWADASDPRPRALVVRIPGDHIREATDGFEPVARELVARVSGTTVLGVWGVRSEPGAPLAHGLIVIGFSQ